MQYLCEIYNSVIGGKTPAAPSGRFENCGFSAAKLPQAERKPSATVWSESSRKDFLILLAVFGGGFRFFLFFGASAQYEVIGGVERRTPGIGHTLERQI